MAIRYVICVKALTRKEIVRQYVRIAIGFMLFVVFCSLAKLFYNENPVKPGEEITFLSGVFCCYAAQALAYIIFKFVSISGNKHVRSGSSNDPGGELCHFHAVGLVIFSFSSVMLLFTIQMNVLGGILASCLDAVVIILILNEII